MKALSFIKNLFIPNKDNDYRARVLHPSALALLVFIFLGAQTAISLVAFIKPGVLGYSSAITPERIIELTNQERVNLGLNPVVANSLLNQAAAAKAADMFDKDYWAHQSPSGQEPWSFLDQAGYDYRVAGENLARDFSNPVSVVEAWMKSPTHRENILNPKFKEIGVAVVDGNLGGISTTLVVQFFGTPTVAAGQNLVPQTAQTVPVAAEELVSTSQELKAVAGQNNNNRPALISPLMITRGLSAFLFGVLTGALLIDGYLVLNKKVYRSTGRTTAHAGFLALMFLLIILSGGPGLIN